MDLPDLAPGNRCAAGVARGTKEADGANPAGVLQPGGAQMITADTIHSLSHFQPRGLPVCSLYVGIPTDPGSYPAVRTRVASLLDEIRPLGEDESLSREGRLSVREDIARIEEILGEKRWKPGAVAIFACHGASLFEEIALPRPIRDRIVVDQTPWIRPLTAVLDEYHRSCVLIVDKKDAQVWDLYMNEMDEVDVVRDLALRKPDYAGWYGLEEHRVSNKAEELEKRHYRRVAQILDQLFRRHDYELLILGGHHDEVPRFEGYLPKRLRDQVAGTFPIDPDHATKADIQRAAAEIVERFERDEERRLVAEVFEAAAERRAAAIGLSDCLWAATVGAVAHLLVHDDAIAPGVVCDTDGWLGETGDTCPVDGSPTRHADDVIDELVERVIDEGGAIEHVEVETQLAPHLVAAALRFPLPPRPS
ncbi:MAG: peptide chain release factor subunit 1 [Pseudonocardiales bacterium]|nr:peptide chain release factor subunit 1 [Pseudonocardiales bacterium]